MTNTEQRPHPMFMTICAIAKRRGFKVQMFEGTILAWMAIIEHTIDSGTIYTVDLCQSKTGELWANRWMLRPSHPGASSELGVTFITPGDGSVSTILAQLRVPVAEQSEADSIAAQHESFELSEVESYWPTDMANWPLSEVFPPADPEFVN